MKYSIFVMERLKLTKYINLIEKYIGMKSIKNL